MKTLSKNAQEVLYEIRIMLDKNSMTRDERIQVINQLGIDTFDKCFFIGYIEGEDQIMEFRFNRGLSLLELIGVLEKVKHSVLETYNKEKRPVKLKRYHHHDSK